MNIEKYKPLITRQLNMFYKKAVRNQWIYNSFFKVYLRKHISSTKDNRYSIITIGSIEVKEEYQNQGFFKLLLSCIEEADYFNYIKVECVNNPILRNYLNKNNWSEVDGGESFLVEIKK